ncbi:MAG: regulatory protein RecX [Bacteroidales bacterium]
MDNNKKLLAKAMKYCAYQERCSNDIKEKLVNWGAFPNDIDSIINQLIDEKFIDDQRFANSYVRSKFTYNKWGKKKIFVMLKQKGIDKEIAEQALNEINEEDYLQTVLNLIQKKTVKAENEFQRKQKVAAWLHSKGFEMDIIWKTLDMEDLV